MMSKCESVKGTYASQINQLTKPFLLLVTLKIYLSEWVCVFTKYLFVLQIKRVIILIFATDLYFPKEFGVFSRKFIPKRTRFGPLGGVMMEDASGILPSSGLIYSVLSEDKTIFLDTSDEGMKAKASCHKVPGRHSHCVNIFPDFVQVFMGSFSVDRFLQLDEVCKKSRQLPGAELCGDAD